MSTTNAAERAQLIREIQTCDWRRFTAILFELQTTLSDNYYKIVRRIMGNHTHKYTFMQHLITITDAMEVPEYKLIRVYEYLVIRRYEYRPYTTSAQIDGRIANDTAYDAITTMCIYYLSRMKNLDGMNFVRIFNHTNRHTVSNIQRDKLLYILMSNSMFVRIYTNYTGARFMRGILRICESNINLNYSTILELYNELAVQLVVQYVYDVCNGASRNNVAFKVLLSAVTPAHVQSLVQNKLMLTYILEILAATNDIKGPSEGRWVYRKHKYSASERRKYLEIRKEWCNMMQYAVVEKLIRYGLSPNLSGDTGDHSKKFTAGDFKVDRTLKTIYSRGSNPQLFELLEMF